MDWIYISIKSLFFKYDQNIDSAGKGRGVKILLFFSYCKYLKGGTHQGSVSNLIFTETFEWTLSWCRGITKLSVFSFPWKLCCPKVFCQNKNYCSQENRLSIRPNDEEYLISKMDLKACLKYSWTEIAIPNSWLGRELFKAIPVYLFLTALIEPCLHDMCRCLLSSHPFMFSCLICVGAFLVLSFFMFWALIRMKMVIETRSFDFQIANTRRA